MTGPRPASAVSPGAGSRFRDVEALANEPREGGVGEVIALPAFAGEHQGVGIQLGIELAHQAALANARGALEEAEGGLFLLDDLMKSGLQFLGFIEATGQLGLNPVNQPVDALLVFFGVQLVDSSDHAQGRATGFAVVIGGWVVVSTARALQLGQIGLRFLLDDLRDIGEVLGDLIVEVRAAACTEAQVEVIVFVAAESATHGCLRLWGLVRDLVVRVERLPLSRRASRA